METPLITLVTVVLNGAATIERTLQSIAAQTYPNIEYIVLDGGSTDGTQAVIERYRPFIRHYRTGPDAGAYKALEEGYTMASGDIMGFVSADDWLSPDACMRIAELYRASPDADLFCFSLQEYRLEADGAETPTRLFTNPDTERFDLLEALYCHGVNRFYSKFLKRHLHFRSDAYPLLADRDMYIRIALDGVKAVRTERVLYHFLVHPESFSMGACAIKRLRHLAETAQMALDYLARKDLSAQQRQALIEWYCFNVIRLAWFRLKARQFVPATRDAFRALARFPLALVKCAVCYKIPSSLRPRSVA